MKPVVIFIVDKNPIHSSLLKYHLTVQRFFHVQIYHSAEECLYRLRKKAVPDYLITEYDLVDHAGFDFLRTVRRICPSTAVIFFSAFDDPVLAMRLIDAGATDYIMKTTKLEHGIQDLIRNIQFLLKEKVHS